MRKPFTLEHVKKRTWRLLLRPLVSLLDLIVPKQPDLVVFGSSGGRVMFGSALSLFEYVTHHTSYRAVFLQEHAQPGNAVYSFDSPRGIWVLVTAGTIFITHGHGDIGGYYLARSRRIHQLWHGVPLKAMGFMERHCTERIARLLRKHNRTIGSFIVSSTYEKCIIAACFHLDPRKIHVLGRPSCDELFADPDCSLPKMIREAADGGWALVLYATTYRPNAQTNYFPFENLDMLEFDQFLTSRKIKIYIRDHINCDSLHQQAGRNIHFLPSTTVPNINSCLRAFHGLITDYSSIFYDFLLLNRPMAFIPYDLEEYKLSPGMLVDDYSGYVPGPVCHTTQDLKNFLRNLANPDDGYQLARRRMNAAVNPLESGKSAATVFKLRVLNSQESRTDNQRLSL